MAKYHAVTRRCPDNKRKEPLNSAAFREALPSTWTQTDVGNSIRPTLPGVGALLLQAPMEKKASAASTTSIHTNGSPAMTALGPSMGAYGLHRSKFPAASYNPVVAKDVCASASDRRGLYDLKRSPCPPSVISKG